MVSKGPWDLDSGNFGFGLHFSPKSAIKAKRHERFKRLNSQGKKGVRRRRLSLNDASTGTKQVTKLYLTGVLAVLHNICKCNHKRLNDTVQLHIVDLWCMTVSLKILL